MCLVAEASAAEDTVKIKIFKLRSVLAWRRGGGWGHRWYLGDVMAHKVECAFRERESGIIIKGIVTGLFWRLFICSWRRWCHLVNDGNGRRSIQVLIVTWNDVGGRLRRVVRSSFRGEDRSKVCMANAAVLGFFVSYMTLLGAAYKAVTDNFVKGFFHL